MSVVLKGYESCVIIYIDDIIIHTLTLSVVQNWFEILMDFDFEIKHIPGIINILPHHLSRLYDLGLERNEQKKYRIISLS